LKIYMAIFGILFNLTKTILRHKYKVDYCKIIN
jgi:hypothetical protein